MRDESRGLLRYSQNCTAKWSNKRRRVGLIESTPTGYVRGLGVLNNGYGDLSLLSPRARCLHGGLEKIWRYAQQAGGASTHTRLSLGDKVLILIDRARGHVFSTGGSRITS